MLSIVFRVVIAVVVAVIVSGFYAGFKKPDAGIYFLDTTLTIGFLIATIATALFSGFVGNTASASSAPARKKPEPASRPAAPKDPSAPREKGTVKWFNVSKGFGFITRENGEDIFAHYRNIRGEGRRRLFDGQLVEFCVIDGDKGLQADDIEILKN